MFLGVAWEGLLGAQACKVFSDFIERCSALMLEIVFLRTERIGTVVASCYSLSGFETFN